MTLRPVVFRYSEVDVMREGGELRRLRVMIPHHRFDNLCGRQFEVGDDYALGPSDEVSNASRGGFFGSLKRAWASVQGPSCPFPSFEHFRARALVAAGWATHSQTVLDTAKDARLFAAGLRKLDAYAVIKISGNVVDVWVAKSIARGAVTAEPWREVKTKALDWAAEQANTTVKELEAHANDGGAL